jgi:hypothetical protein
VLLFDEDGFAFAHGKKVVVDEYFADKPEQPTFNGSATLSHGHAATAIAGCIARLGGRPRRLGATQAGSGAW